jgi:hypothetical protein
MIYCCTKFHIIMVNLLPPSNTKGSIDFSSSWLYSLDCYCCDGVRLCLVDLRLLRDPLSFPRWYMNEYGATLKWYWWRKPKNSEKNLSQCHFVHRKFHGTYLSQTQATMVISHWLTTTCAMEWPTSVHILSRFNENSPLSSKVAITDMVGTFWWNKGSVLRVHSHYHIVCRWINMPSLEVRQQ